MGNSGGGTTRNIAEPWGGIKPYLTGYYGAATNWYNNYAPEQYPGQRTADLTDQQLAALGQQESMARYTLPSQVNATQGTYFQNLNPYANPMMGQVGGMMGSANQALSGILGQPYQTPGVRAPNMPYGQSPFPSPGSYQFQPPETTPLPGGDGQDGYTRVPGENMQQPGLPSRPPIVPSPGDGGGGGGGGFNWPDYPVGVGPPTEDALDDLWPFAGSGELGNRTGVPAPNDVADQVGDILPFSGNMQAGGGNVQPGGGIMPTRQSIDNPGMTAQVTGQSTVGIPGTPEAGGGTPPWAGGTPHWQVPGPSPYPGTDKGVLPTPSPLPGGGGQLPTTTPGTGPASIPTGYNVPQIGFNPQTQQINPGQFTPSVDPTLGAPSPTGSLEQMMSGTPNMDVWEPVMDAATRGTIEQFNREVLPGITEQEIGSGQWGSSRADIARGVAAGDVGEAIADARARLGQQAASEALQQRSTGTNIAAQLRQAGGQLGLGAAELGGRLGTSQAQLGQAAQELGGQLAGQQAQLGLATNQLNEQQRASMAGERINAADIQMGAAQDIYGNLMNNYSRQLGLAPSITEMGMMPSTVMSQVGGAYQDQQQRMIDEAMNRWNYEQQLPLNMLSQYRDLLNAPGSNIQSSFQSGPEPNPTAAGLGGAASGAGMGYMYTSGNPWGALIGGVIGGGLGYFGSQ